MADPAETETHSADNRVVQQTELAVNIERRRAGEVAIGVLHDSDNGRAGFAWVPAADARDFAWRILLAARDSEDMADV